MVQASRNVCAIRLVFSSGSFAHSSTPVAESIRITPYSLIFRSRSLRPMRHAFLTWVRKPVRCVSSPMAEPPPVPPQTGATSEPAFRFFDANFPASAWRSSSDESMSVCGSDRNRSTPSNPTPSTRAAAVRFSIVSKSIGGSEPGPFPTSPGHIAL